MNEDMKLLRYSLVFLDGFDVLPSTVVRELVEVVAFPCIGRQIGHSRRVLCRFVKEHLINVSGVLRAAHCWFERRRNLLAQQLLPVDLRKPGMPLEFLCVIIRSTQSLDGVSLEQAWKQAFGLNGEVGLHVNALFNDVSHHLLSVLRVVRGSSSQHLIDQSTLQVIKRGKHLRGSTSQRLYRGPPQWWSLAPDTLVYHKKNRSCPRLSECQAPA